VTMASAAGSLFARTYAGHTGVDPYTTAVSDVYQDLFGEGSFTGKGLYDVDAFAAALEGRVPENALLSHDLFEGLYARTALVTDVEVVDEYPASVLGHARRQHRWVRGDWQLLWWLFPLVPTRTGLERNRLPLIARWKILDNLRRSLVPPTTAALLIAGWVLLPGHPAIWTAAALAALAYPAFARLTAALTGPPKDQSWGLFIREAGEDLRTHCTRLVLQLTFMASEAAERLHAIVVSHTRPAARMGDHCRTGGAQRAPSFAHVRQGDDRQPGACRRGTAARRGGAPKRMAGGAAGPAALDYRTGDCVCPQPASSPTACHSL
jgi:cyclic beta-1,2-glucan synthetase